MRHFKIYRKLILVLAVYTAILAVVAALFWKNSSVFPVLLGIAPILLCCLLFLLDFLHNRYDDDLLEKITLLIEALTEQQEPHVFPEDEDTLTARLQHQLLKLRNILIAQNQMLAQEKEQIKTLISDISHQIKTPVAAANTFAQLLGRPYPSPGRAGRVYRHTADRPGEAYLSRQTALSKCPAWKAVSSDCGRPKTA